MEELRQTVVNDVVGGCDAIVKSPLEYSTPKGLENAQMPLVYCDFTASHRPLASVEDYIRQECLPSYGNTHTTTSLTGSQSTAFTSEARQIVGEFCGAKTTGKASQDVVLFAGNGTTGAVHLLIDCLGLKHHVRQYQQHPQGSSDNPARPVIFVGPYEHHSNLLPWRELGGVDVEIVPFVQGSVDLEHLEKLLQRYQSRSVKIGSFSAASNVTGTVANDLAITALLHQYGALSIWDYATGASYLDMNMNPTHPDYPNSSLIAKDAIVWSGHKLLGAACGTPGVLVVKKALVSQQNPPTLSGGGTVFYVTPNHHRFLSNRMERYEGGTPNIVGVWRLGLAVTAKQRYKRRYESLQASSSSTQPNLSFVEYEMSRAQRIQQRLAQIPNLVLLDDLTQHASSSETPKLPIFSFLIKCGTRFLHYNFVSALLNDLFGIQSRGGCQCAGPFAQQLLGLTQRPAVNAAVEECLVHDKDELLRPGFTRLSLPFLGTTQEQENYVLEALEWTAQHGWKFLPVYRCNSRTGEWRHKSRQGAPLGKSERKWLSHYSTSLPQEHANELPPSFSQAMANANTLLELVLQDHPSLMQALKMTHESDDASYTSSSSLRWFVYPKEVANVLQQGLDQVPGTMDRDNLVGAIQPFAWYPVVEPKDDADALPQFSSVARTENPSDAVGVSVEELFQGQEEVDNHGGSGEANVAPKVMEPKNPIVEFQSTAEEEDLAKPVAFRDGEHTGEAPWNEIEEGFDDGELSSECEIFNSTTDEWEQIGVVIDRKKECRPTTKVPIAAKEEVPTETPQITSGDVVMLEKNEKKKPQRDSTTWGQGTMMPLKLPNPGIENDTMPADAVVQQTSKRKRHKHTKPPAKLMRLVTQAMIQWDMLEEGDRLLLGLSGGKDSLSLLHVLLEFQKKLPINFEIEVCTIDPMTPSFDPSPLIPYVESLGLKYHYIRDQIVDRANNAGKDGKIVSSLCAYCARMKRGNLYSCARQNNCNKLVLAQHLDDLAESFMMSVMHNGFLRTMKANYKINAGDLSVIRPLVYCRESLMTDFAKSSNFPIINENCPACFEEPKERARVKKLMSREEALYPNFYDNIKRSILPLMHDDATAILRSYTEEALAKSKKENNPKKRRRNSKPPPANADLPEEKKSDENQKSDTDVAPMETGASLADASEEQLMRELARRRAERYRLAGAMRRVDDDEDPTGQVCTLNGGNGSIPCRELME